MEVFFNYHKNKIILILVIISVFLVIFRFTDTPKVWLDEGVFSEVAKNFVWHGNQGLQTEPGKFFPMHALTTSGYPLTVPVGLSVYIFGNGLWQVRLPMILYMLGVVLLYYLFVKNKFGFYTAVLSVLSLLSFSPFYGNGRPVQGEIPGLFFLVLGFYLFSYFEKTSFTNKRLAIISGLSLGLSSASKPIYFLVLLAIAPIVFIFWYKTKKIGVGINKKVLTVFFLSFLIPLLVLFFLQFPTKEALSTIVPVYKLLISNHESTIPLWKTIYINFSRFFTESTPILFTILFSTILFSYIFNFVKNRKIDFSLSELMIVCFIFVNWCAYLVGTGWYRYFFPAQALIYLLFVSSAFRISELSDSRLYKRVFFLLPFVIILLQFYHLIFISDTSLSVRRTRNSDISSVISKVQNTKSIFFYNTIEGIVFLRGDNYSQYLKVGTSIDAGDKNYLNHPKSDYIFVNAEEQDVNLDIKCYEREKVNKYYFYQRISGCK